MKIVFKRLKLTREGHRLCAGKNRREKGSRDNSEGGNYSWRRTKCRSRHAGRFIHATRAVNQL